MNVFSFTLLPGSPGLPVDCPLNLLKARKLSAPGAKMWNFGVTRKGDLHNVEETKLTCPADDDVKVHNDVNVALYDRLRNYNFDGF